MSAWVHSRKGKIVGEEVGGAGEWMHVRLSEDAWADARHRYVDPAGTTQTYRRSFMVEVAGRTSDIQGSEADSA